jgi:hypothetical protein
MTRHSPEETESLLVRARRAFAALVDEAGLGGATIIVTARTLSTEEAIGRPLYDDLPILRGKEVMIEAEFQAARGHAFTSAPSSWSGTVGDLLALPLEQARERALLNAAMNAVLRSLGAIDRTVHCHSEDIARCGAEIAAHLRQEFGPIPVGLVGYQPGLAAGLVEQLGPDAVRITDLLEENVGRTVHGVEIWDGATQTDALVRRSRLILATGSTAANGTLDQLQDLAAGAGVPLIVYGVTAAAACHLCAIRRLCLLAH